jgi:hypothetical protein
MPTVDDQIAEWKHAYQVLGVPQHASAHVIKAAYRKLVKRWHPDLYTPGTLQHADATQMSMLINEAYSETAHAPLRYTSSSSGIGRAPRQQPQRPFGPIIKTQINPFKPPRVDRFEFWVRFVCGAFFGMFSGVARVLSEVPATSMEYPLIRWLRCPRPYRGLRPGCGSIRGQVLIFGFKVLLIARGSGARTVNERT